MSLTVLPAVQIILGKVVSEEGPKAFVSHAEVTKELSFLLKTNHIKSVASV